MINLTTMSFVAPQFLKATREPNLPTMKINEDTPTIDTNSVNSLPKIDKIVPLGFVQRDGVTHLYVEDENEKSGKRLSASVLWDNRGIPVEAITEKKTKKKTYKTASIDQLVDQLGFEQGYKRSLLESFAKEALPAPSTVNTEVLLQRFPDATFYTAEFQKHITIAQTDEGKDYIKAIDVNEETIPAILSTLNLILRNTPAEGIPVFMETIERIEKSDRFNREEAQEKLSEMYAEFKKQVQQRKIDVAPEQWSWISFSPATFAAIQSYDPDHIPQNGYDRFREFIAKQFAGNEKNPFVGAHTEIGGVTFGYSSALQTSVVLDNSRLFNKAYIMFEGYEKKSKMNEFSNKLYPLLSALKNSTGAKKITHEKSLEQLANEIKVYMKEKLKLSPDFEAKHLIDFVARSRIMIPATLKEKEILVGTTADTYEIKKRSDGRFTVNTNTKGYDYNYAQSINNTAGQSVIETLHRTVVMGKDTGDAQTEAQDNTIDLQIKSTYAVTGIQTKHKYYPMAFSKKLNEKIAYAVDQLVHMDDKGEIHRDVIDKKTGEIKKETISVNIDERVEAIIKIIEEDQEKRSSHPHVKKAAAVLMAKLTDASLMEGTQKISAIKGLLTNSEAVYANIVNAALKTNSWELKIALDTAYSAMKLPKVADNMVAAITKGLSEGNLVETAEYPDIPKIGTKEERSKLRKSMSSLYRTMIRNIHHRDTTILKLASEGENTPEFIKRAETPNAKEATLSTKVNYAPDVRLLKNTLSMYRMLVNNEMGYRQSFYVSPEPDRYTKKAMIVIKEGKETEVVMPRSLDEINALAKQSIEVFKGEDEKITPFIDDVIETQASKTKSRPSSVSVNVINSMLGGEEDIIQTMVAEGQPKEAEKEEAEEIAEALRSAPDASMDISEVDTSVLEELNNTASLEEEINALLNIVDDGEEFDISVGAEEINMDDDIEVTDIPGVQIG